jgi:hypothetical protein
MGDSQPLSKWIPAQDYAAVAGMKPGELIKMIVDGGLPGEYRDGDWFVARPLVVLEHPSEAEAQAWLKISACRLGSYVTAGRGEMGIPLRFDDPGRPAALVALEEAMKKRPVLPIEIYLNGEYFLVDSSLWRDLSAALFEYEVLVDPSIVGV